MFEFEIQEMMDNLDKEDSYYYELTPRTVDRWGDKLAEVEWWVSISNNQQTITAPLARLEAIVKDLKERHNVK